MTDWDRVVSFWTDEAGRRLVKYDDGRLEPLDAADEPGTVGDITRTRTEKPKPSPTHSVAVGPKVAGDALRVVLRDLWDEHVALTRMVIVSFAAGLPDLAVVQARLMKNQDAIAQAVGAAVPLEPAATAKLASLLKQHIAGAVDVLKAAKSGNASAALAAWDENGRQLADFIAAPFSLTQTQARTMIQAHLDATVAEAVARLKGDWAADIAAYDKARQHALHMADVMAQAKGG